MEIIGIDGQRPRATTIQFSGENIEYCLFFIFVLAAWDRRRVTINMLHLHFVAIFDFHKMTSKGSYYKALIVGERETFGHVLFHIRS